MPFGYICPFCRQTVQVGSVLPVGRPVKCPGCKKLYTANAPGTVGTAPASAPAPSQPVAAAAAPAEQRGRPIGRWFQAGAERTGKMEVKQLLATCVFLFMLAVIPTIFAWTEWRVSATATAEPLAVELAQLEKGPAPENNHLKIGPHTACYFATISHYTTSKKAPNKRPDASTKVDYSFYPIISPSHPYWEQIRKAQEKYSKLDKVPDHIEWPRMSNFRVLVRTTRFRTFGDIPDEDTRTDPSVQGLVINRISTLDSEEQRLIKQDFPDVDFDKLLILSDGRRPSSGWFAFFLLCLSMPFWLGIPGVFGCWMYQRFLKRA